MSVDIWSRDTLTAFYKEQGLPTWREIIDAKEPLDTGQTAVSLLSDRIAKEASAACDGFGNIALLSPIEDISLWSVGRTDVVCTPNLFNMSDRGVEWVGRKSHDGYMVDPRRTFILPHAVHDGTKATSSDLQLSVPAIRNRLV